MKIYTVSYKRGILAAARFTLLVWFFVFVGMLTSVSSYVLSGPHVLELMIKKIGKTNRLLVEQALILHDNSTGQHGAAFKEIVRYVFPETFRSDILSETIQHIHLVTRGIVLTVTDGKYALGTETLMDQYKDILLYRSRKMLEHKLTSAGVDVSVSSFGRFQDMIAYVLGAEYPDQTRSQLWIEKDTFLPIRLLLKRNDADFLEFRYYKWEKMDGITYPMHIECYHNGKLIREMKVTSWAANPQFSEDLFDIKLLQSLYVQEAPDERPLEAVDEIQKTIEEFKKLYEQSP